MIFEEALNQQINNTIKQAESEILKSLSAYLIKVMPFTYKKGYALNIMFNSKYSKLNDKESILSTVRNIAEKYNGKVKSIEDKDNVIKIFF